MTTTFDELILAQLTKGTVYEGDCWRYQPQKTKNGRVKISYHKKAEYTYRVSYMIFKGEIPKDKIVHQTCRVPNCWNPNHLVLKEHPMSKGSNNVLAKTTAARVLEIRARYAKGGITQQELAKMFGISQPTIRQILSRETWTHI